MGKTVVSLPGDTVDVRLDGGGGERAYIQQAVAERRNIMVAGSTASGKTMLCNAIIQEIAQQFPDQRLLILEDTPELQCIY